MVNMKGAKACLETMDLKPNYSALGRKYHIDRRTAKKHYEGFVTSERRKRSSLLDKYIDLIKQKLSIPGVSMKVVYEYIRMNVDANIGGYSNFRKFVQKNNDTLFEKNTDAHVLFETECGEQLQYDWKGPITLNFKDNTKYTFYIFSATLSASRFHKYILSEFMTRESVQRCLIETFETIGGVTKEALTDNMSCIVNIAKFDFVPEFKAFAKDMGFVPKHCKANHPYTKGKDESCNRFVNWLLPYDYELKDKEDLINTLKKLEKEINKEVNQTTNMPPVSLFQEEKEYLQPLPRKDIIESYFDDLVPAKVQNTMLVYYKGSKYSVPKKYIGQTVKIKEIDNKLFIYYNKDLIAMHEISDKKICYKKEDYIEGLSSMIWNKTPDDIEKLAEKNLELIEKITKQKERR